MVRCKFRVLGVERTWDGFEVVRLAPVSGSESEENRLFWSATPSGEGRFRFSAGAEGWGQFEANALVYLDLVPFVVDDPCEGAILAPVVYLCGRTHGSSFNDEGRETPGDVRVEFTPVQARRLVDRRNASAWGSGYGGLTYWFSTSNRAAVEHLTGLLRLVVTLAS